MTWRVDDGDCREVMARMEPEPPKRNPAEMPGTPLFGDLNV